MKFFSFLTGLAVVFLVYSNPVWAHGVYGTVTPHTGIKIKAVYDGGEPMAYAAVEVFRNDDKLAFQTGRTDRNGCFAFLPDMPGTWKITVNDGTGHRLALETRVDENLIPKDNATSSERSGEISRYGKVLMGISIIFGIFGIWVGIAGKKKTDATKCG